MKTVIATAALMLLAPFSPVQAQAPQVHALIDEAANLTKIALSAQTMAINNLALTFVDTEEITPELCMLGIECGALADQYFGIVGQSAELARKEIEPSKVGISNAKQFLLLHLGQITVLGGMAEAAETMQYAVYEGILDADIDAACAERRFLLRGEDIRYACLAIYYNNSKESINESIRKHKEASGAWDRVAEVL